jgi:hypothetical protein
LEAAWQERTGVPVFRHVLLLGSEDGARADYYEVEVLIHLEVLVSSEQMLRWIELRKGESCDACTMAD